jgi:hypothetical protein
MKSKLALEMELLSRGGLLAFPLILVRLFFFHIFSGRYEFLVIFIDFGIVLGLLFLAGGLVVMASRWLHSRKQKGVKAS